MDPDPRLAFRLDPDPHKTDADPKHYVTVPVVKFTDLISRFKAMYLI
jgi:hypothetical protein